MDESTQRHKKEQDEQIKREHEAKLKRENEWNEFSKLNDEIFEKLDHYINVFHSDDSEGILECVFNCVEYACEKHGVNKIEFYKSLNKHLNNYYDD